jgi:acyl carrier protein phosphodiesterase
VNYLAHLYLSPPGEDAMLGSLLGDFVKGPLNSVAIREQYSKDITRGIELHRKIDSFTDAHPVVTASRNRVSRSRRRFAGVMIDMFYDHFLAKYWEEFHHRPLDAFTGDFYRILMRRHAQLPERAQRTARFMADLDWLGSYAHLEAVDTALNRMSQRLRRTNTLIDSARELEHNYAEFERDFRCFMPDAIDFAQTTARRLSLFQAT